MTQQSRRIVAIAVVLALAAIGGVLAVMKLVSGPAARSVTIATQPATRPAYPHAASASLGRLDLMRQAVLEADVPDDFRRKTLTLIDDTHRQLTDLLDEQKSAATTHDARMEQITDAFTRAVNSDQNAASAVRDQLGFIWFELDLLSRRRLLPLMFEKLELTPEQHAQANAAFMEVSVVLRNEPAGGMPNERSMQAMLSGREKLHALLTPAQREKLTAVLREQQQARSRPRLSGATTQRMSSSTTRAATQP